MTKYFVRVEAPSTLVATIEVEAGSEGEAEAEADRMLERRDPSVAWRLGGDTVADGWGEVDGEPCVAEVEPEVEPELSQARGFADAARARLQAAGLLEGSDYEVGVGVSESAGGAFVEVHLWVSRP